MNNEQLFRQALQRQNDRAARMKMPADMEQRVTERIARQNAELRHRRVWLFAAIGAVAASLLLLLTLQISKTGHERSSASHLAAAEKTATERVTTQGAKAAHSISRKTGTHDKRAATAAGKRRTTAPMPVQPDTLGDGIWQQKENVLRAIEMLSDCEQTIEHSEQRIRNGIVEATYHATPQPAGAQLVVCDNGDYMVVEDSQPVIIEL